MKAFTIFLVFLIFCPAFSQFGWEPLVSGTTVNLNAVWFVDDSTGFVAGDNGLVLKTTDAGFSWSDISPAGAPNLYGIYFFNADSGLVVGQSGKIFRTTDGGATWSEISSGIFSKLRSVSFCGDIGICGAQDQGILYSQDAGRTWTVFQSGFMGGGFFGASMVNENVGYLGGENSIFQPILAKTTNGGMNWSFSVFYLNNNEGRILALDFINPDTGFAASRLWNGGGAISVTSDGGQNWNTTIFNTTMNGVEALDVDTMVVVYAVGDQGMIVKSINYGGFWMFQNSGVAAALNAVHFLNPDTGFVVGSGGVILRTTTGGEPPNRLTNDRNSTIPRTTRLVGNYPNPFNPSTRIAYRLATTARVVLEIFDITGRQVAILNEGVRTAGSYQTEWQAGTLPGGVYFCRMTATAPDNLEIIHQQTIKMVLIR